MYDKCGIVLHASRPPPTTCPSSSNHRKVEHRQRAADPVGIAPLKKTNKNPRSKLRRIGGRKEADQKNAASCGNISPKEIYSLIDLREILLGCNRRYLAHLSALDDFSAGVRALGRLTRSHEVDGKTVKGINFFEPGDSALLHALQNPSVNIAGIRSRAELLPNLEMFSPARLSLRQLRRLLDLGVIKRIKGTYRYYLTKAGRAATAAAAERLKRASNAICSGYDLMGFLRRRSRQEFPVG